MLCVFLLIEKAPQIQCINPIPQLPEKNPKSIESFPLNPSQGTLKVFHVPTQSGISVESVGAAVGIGAGLCFCCFLGDLRFRW